MPGLAHRNDQCCNATSSSPAAAANGFWSKNRGDVCYNQLQKFWSDLPPRAREELLRIDKQMLFEQSRKNMYCSRCNGLLLKGFPQIVMYGKSFHQEGAFGQHPSVKSSASRIQDDSGLSTTNSCQEEIQDPSVHPWGGLTTTRDGLLTLLDCYLYAKSLRGLQIVFDSARARERERELLYPDACGGGGRGWISQGVAAYGRGHGIRESCALHTARLSCDTLVDFWSALGDETRQSLLRMKEEDFIERLVYRFDSKRFCRDCRRNVIREFKELKELKRMRREPHCTSCFCVADTAFQYEVSDDTIQADWHQTFADSFGSYRFFEWAVGTGEGKSDILEFEDIGLNGSVQVTGLDLTDLNACFITLRAWKFDGRCTELSVKAHALKGQQCVHNRLVVGDGLVSITRGESIRCFFEHAEEAEEEEDDDSTDRDGNDLDGECSRPQKHAKSPELAREFLLDAAIVIFKEQVEKAFREGTAQQNAHSIFVCLSLKLLEERVHIACKEIITLEKQMKLLEEEEKEKREEEERKERRRTKEREKKLRRKERLKGKEKDREKKDSEVDGVCASCDASKQLFSLSANKEPSEAVNCDASIKYSADIVNPMPISSDTEEAVNTGCSPLQTEDISCESPEADTSNVKEENDSFATEQSKFLHRRINPRKERQPESSFKWSDRQRYSAISEGGTVCNKTELRYHGDNFVNRTRGVYGAHRQMRTNMTKSNFHSTGSKCGEKIQSSINRMSDRYDAHSCSCNQINEYREKIDSHVSNRAVRDPKFVVKSELVLDMSKHSYRGNRYSQADNIRQGSKRTKSKLILANNSRSHVLYSKKVWEPMELQKKYSRSSSDSDVTLMSSSFKVEADTSESTKSGENCSSEDSGDSSEVTPENSCLKESRNSISGMDVCQNGLKAGLSATDSGHLTEAGDQEADSYHGRDNSFNRISDTRTSSNSNSDNCSSCLSEVDSNASSSNHGNPESSSTSDSEYVPQQLERTEMPSCNGTSEFHKVELEDKDTTSRMGLGGQTCIPPDGNGSISGTLLVKGSQPSSNINSNPLTRSKHQPDVFQMHHQNLYCHLFQGPIMGYYPQPWSAVPTNGLMPFPPNNYLYAGPYGFGIDGNSGMCMQYEPMQHLAPPLFNAGPVPVYQPTAKANGVYHEEKTQTPKQSGPPKNLDGVDGERCVPSVTKHTDVPQNGEDGQKNSCAKMGADTTGFSLFHFGGPVALSNIKSNKPSEEAAINDIASKVVTDAMPGNHILNKKETTVEEYNLFAGSKLTSFPFF